MLVYVIQTQRSVILFCVKTALKICSTSEKKNKRVFETKKISVSKIEKEKSKKPNSSADHTSRLLVTSYYIRGGNFQFHPLPKLHTGVILRLSYIRGRK